MAGISMDSVSNLSPEFQKAFQLSAKAEMKPIEKMEQRKANVDEKLKLMGDVLGKIDGVKKLIPNLNSPIAIRDLLVNTDDSKAVTGTVDKVKAQPGKYNLEVLQLAKSASALSNGFEDKDQTRVGTGYIAFTTASGDAKEIFVDDENGTLEGVASLINSARVGMKATVINDQSDPDAPYRLLLSAEGQGTGNNVEYPSFYFVDGEEELSIEVERPALNAMLKYEGFEFESPSNELKDLIHGVTLNIKGLTDPGKPATISIEQDIPKTTLKVKELVDNLNSVFGFIQNQNALDKDSDTMKTLGGDYGIRLTEDRLKTALRENFLGAEGRNLRTLADIGIQFTNKGMLKFDDKKFENALSTNFEDTAELLAGDGATSGMITKLNGVITSVTQSGTGILANQKTTFTNQSQKFAKDIESKTKLAEQRAEALKGKLARAQTAIQQMSGQTGFFQQEMGGAGQGNSIPLG